MPFRMRCTQCGKVNPKRLEDSKGTQLAHRLGFKSVDGRPIHLKRAGSWGMAECGPVDYEEISEYHDCMESFLGEVI